MIPWLARWLALAGMVCVLGACAMAPSTGADEAGMRGDSTRFIVLAVANPLETPPSRAGTSMPGYAAPRRYTVGSLAARTIAALAREYALRETSGWPIPSLGVHCVVFELPPGAERAQVMAALARDARVQLVQPLQDFDVHAEAQGGMSYNDPYVHLQRGFMEIHAAQAHRMSVGKDVHVAVVDTGADTTHPDLQGRIHATYNLVDSDATHLLQDRHGTEVVGIIAATGNNLQGIVGMAPQARLSLYKACWQPPGGATARCNSFTLAKALATVMESNAKIINLSLGGPPDELLSQLLGQLLKQGRIVVAALPPGAEHSGFPAGVPGVIVVGMGGLGDLPLLPANTIVAPGRDILTLQPGGHYDFATGSSMAAAHVTGVVALLYAMAPQLERAEILDILTRSANPAPSAPQIDAERALLALHARHQQVAKR